MKITFQPIANTRKTDSIQLKSKSYVSQPKSDSVSFSGKEKIVEHMSEQLLEHLLTLSNKKVKYNELTNGERSKQALIEIDNVAYLLSQTTKKTKKGLFRKAIDETVYSLSKPKDNEKQILHKDGYVYLMQKVRNAFIPVAIKKHGASGVLDLLNKVGSDLISQTSDIQKEKAYQSGFGISVENVFNLASGGKIGLVKIDKSPLTYIKLYDAEGSSTFEISNPKQIEKFNQVLALKNAKLNKQKIDEDYMNLSLKSANAKKELAAFESTMDEKADLANKAIRNASSKFQD